MRQFNNGQIKDFANIFPGRSDAWGALHGQAIKEPVTQAHYARHLNGGSSLRIYPLTREGSVKWFAIDLDRQDPALALNIVNTFMELGIDQGLYLERSKGKGYHVFVLLADWVPAPAARSVAKAVLRTVGLPLTTEIFPKQDRLTQRTPWGNYLNLPYFGGDHPEGRRMMLNPQNFLPFRFSDWLDQATCLPAKALESIVTTLPEEFSSETESSQSKTKALDLLSTTHTTGTRRPALVSLAGILRVRSVHEDVAVELLLPWAREHFEPNLPDGELEKHVRGIYQRYGVGGGSRSNLRARRILPNLEVQL